MVWVADRTGGLPVSGYAAQVASIVVFGTTWPLPETSRTYVAVCDAAFVTGTATTSGPRPPGKPSCSSTRASGPERSSWTVNVIDSPYTAFAAGAPNVTPAADAGIAAGASAATARARD